MGAHDLPTEPIHRLTVAQYDQMAAAGILKPEDRVELLEGWLVTKMTKKPPHRIATRRTRVAIESVLPDGWYADTQEPIVTADSEPEPDVSVIRGRTEDYSEQNPTADRVGLVVEIADSTLTRDREIKARVHARAGIPTYWILDLATRTLEVLSDPGTGEDGAAYRASIMISDGERVSLCLDGREIATLRVADLLP